MVVNLPFLLAFIHFHSYSSSSSARGSAAVGAVAQLVLSSFFTALGLVVLLQLSLMRCEKYIVVVCCCCFFSVSY